MASELSREALRKLARLGAARRLEELRQEEAAIRAAFPDLQGDESRAPGRRGRPPRRETAAEGSGKTAGRRSAKRGYKMSAAQKKLVSERMKKYWAARRKAKG